MKRILAALTLLTVASLGAVGCGDDDDSTSNTGGSSSTGGEPSSSNGGAPTGEGGSAFQNVMCDATADGVCQNEMDCPFVVDGSARTTAQACGQECVLSGSTDENCGRDCILNGSDKGSTPIKGIDISSDCAQCYADIVACTAKNCLGQCLQHPDSAECKTCQDEKGCRSAFNDCSGLPPE